MTVKQLDGSRSSVLSRELRKARVRIAFFLTFALCLMILSCASTAHPTLSFAPCIWRFDIHSRFRGGALPAAHNGRLTDNDDREIQEKGGKIVILDPKYSNADLDMARKSCQ